MEALELKADARTIVGRHVKYLRQQGIVPVVLYGRGVEAQSLQVDEKLLTKVLDVAGTHQLVNLQIGNDQQQLTLARDIQRDPIRRNYVHVDFYVVRMDEKVNAQIPLVLVGEAPAVDNHGGILTQGLDELDIECLPNDLISSIEVDVSSLTEINDTISVSDLTVPSTITVLSDPDSMVVKIEPPRLVAEEEEEEEELERVETGAEPEVLTSRREGAEEEE